jgi:hypothetical protein
MPGGWFSSARRIDRLRVADFCCANVSEGMKAQVAVFFFDSGGKEK